MPRYLVETRPTTASDRDRALRLAAVRFPEVAVEHGYAARAEHDSRDVWVCRAPSKAHIQRWAAAARLALGAVRHIETDAVQLLEPRRDQTQRNTHIHTHEGRQGDASDNRGASRVTREVPDLDGGPRGGDRLGGDGRGKHEDSRAGLEGGGLTVGRRGAVGGRW